MKKLIFTVLLLALLFTGFWYYSAQQIENFIAGKLAKAEEQFQKKGFLLKHEGLSISGFPFGYEVTLKSPSITRTGQGAGMQELFGSASLDGSISLSSNLVGSKFTLTKSGKSRFIVPNMQRGNLKEDEFTASGKASFIFSAEEESYVEAIKNPFKTLFELLEKNDQFLIGKKGVIDLKNIKFSHAENEAVSLMQLDDGEIRYSISDVNEKEIALDFSGDIKGLDLDTLIMGSDAFTPGSERSLKEIALLLSMPKPGKINIDFDLEAKLPSKDSEAINQQNPNFAKMPAFRFDLKKMTVTSNFGSNRVKGLTFLTDITDGKRQLHHSLISTFENSKEQFDALRDTWEDFLSNLPVCQGNEAIKPSPACPVIKSLIPKFDTFGKITFQSDLDFDVNDVDDLFNGSKLVIRHLDYFAEIYGLKSDGEADFKQPEVIKAVYKINLLNYKEIFQDLFSYLKKMEQFLPYLTEEAASLPKLSENQLKLILNYLRVISDEPEKELKDIRITLFINDPNSFKIGTLSAVEFEKKTAELMQELSKEMKNGIENKKEEIK
ncbi:MAG TPA: DUF2125 domain-containing protein [Parachlamydiaceae bacterium]|nr:DUF2125 domain-containing protein [Parachlamydiaceae bacterium]